MKIKFEKKIRYNQFQGNFRENFHSSEEKVSRGIYPPLRKDAPAGICETYPVIYEVQNGMNVLNNWTINLYDIIEAIRLNLWAKYLQGYNSLGIKR